MTTPTISMARRESALAQDAAIRRRLRELTAARVGLRRTGDSLATSEVLDFQLAHARARDAVHAALQPASLLAELRSLTHAEPLALHSAAAGRKIYLQRPDLGRKLDPASRHRLQAVENPALPWEIALVIADGLSALAVERHATPLLRQLLSLLAQSAPEPHLAPVCLVEQGRVAIGDEIACALSTPLAVVFIGERPGLSSPDSLGAYITWNPKPGITTDADRNCISNIRPEGLSYADAASRLFYYIREARRLEITGTALKDPELQLPAGTP